MDVRGAHDPGPVTMTLSSQGGAFPGLPALSVAEGSEVEGKPAAVNRS